MRMRIKCTVLLGLAFVTLTGLWAVAADEPAKTDGQPLTVIDGNGKEHKLKTWKFTTGTRRLAWLAPPAEKEPEAKDKAEPKAPPKAKLAGPEALVFREENSTNFEDGIPTLVPLDRLLSIEYDHMKETVKLTAATGPKADDTETLTGATGFVGAINKLSIEAEVDKGDLGVAEVKFLGGVAKGIASLKFPVGAKIETPPEGRLAIVTVKANNKGEKLTLEVRDLQALYRVGGGETLSPLLFFKKTIKIDVAKVGKITVTKADKETAWGVTMKAGGEESLSLLTNPMLDGKPAVLEGFIGRVPVGYKQFPVGIIEEVQFDEKPKKLDAE